MTDANNLTSKIDHANEQNSTERKFEAFFRIITFINRIYLVISDIILNFAPSKIIINN